jgi:hypothetical protein
MAVGDYPEVTHLLLYTTTRQIVRLPWNEVQRINQQAQHIHVANLASVQETSPAWLAQQVLVKRDLLDALVLDLADYATMLVNDVWLQEEHGTLRICSADRSPWAIVRRLSHGWLARGSDPLYLVGAHFCSSRAQW